MSDIIETGLEPEFVVTDLAWWELIAGGAAVRLCFATRRHGVLVAQYTKIIGLADLDKIRLKYRQMRTELIGLNLMVLDDRPH